MAASRGTTHTHALSLSRSLTHRALNRLCACPSSPSRPCAVVSLLLRCKRGVAATGMRGRGWLVGVQVGALLSLCAVCCLAGFFVHCAIWEGGAARQQPASSQPATRTWVSRYFGAESSTVFRSLLLYTNNSLAFPFRPSTPRHASSLIKIRSLKYRAGAVPVLCHATGDALAPTSPRWDDPHSAASRRPGHSASSPTIDRVLPATCPGWDPPCARPQKVRSCPVVTHPLGEVLAC